MKLNCQLGLNSNSGKRVDLKLKIVFMVNFLAIVHYV